MNEKLHILLIEDNPGDAFLIKFYLEESTVMEYDLEHREFMADGLELLGEKNFDVVLLDLNLPDSDGIASLEKVLKAQDDIVVIVLTGLDDDELGIQTVQLGAQDFLAKGQFDGKVLNSAIRYAFQRHQLYRQLRRATKDLDSLRWQFEAVQELSELGYFEMNSSDHSFKFSSALADMLGLDDVGDTVNYEDFLSCIHPDDRNEVVACFADLGDQSSQLSTTFRLNTDTSDEINCRALYSPSFSKVIGVLQKISID